LDRDWQQTEALLTALNAPLILVRLDVEAPYPGRAIASPDALAQALRVAPNFTSVSTIGSLELFALTTAIVRSQPVPIPVTVNSQEPDLRLLSVLPRGTALVSLPPQPGVPNVVQSPPVEMWQDTGSSLEWQHDLPIGWNYRVAEVGSKTMIPLVENGTMTD